MTASATAPASPYTLHDFDFVLPPELIAQQPAAERSGSRLLDASGGPSTALVDRSFRELPSLLRAGDLLVFNDTRVIRARLLGRKASGGAVEALVERVLDAGADDDAGGGAAASGAHRVLVHLRASKPPKPGSSVHFDARADGGGEGFEARVIGRGGAGEALYLLEFPADPYALLERCGHVPLPPYIAHSDDADDERRYQTVFARTPGAVAAPTAALHFDEAVLQALAALGVGSAHVTLHVGAGTFQPMRGDDIGAHVMHSERYEVGASTLAAIAATQARGGRVLAVGTTTLRALESAALAGALDARAAAGQAPAGIAGETSIFITPGFEFRIVDLLLTNFHLPKSTLLMLVSAFAGHERMRRIYRHAIEARYRFFSYGDSMLLARA